MTRRTHARSLLLLMVVLSAGACAGPAEELDIALVPGAAPADAVIRLRGLSGSERATFARTDWDAASWQAVLRVSVAGQPPDRPAVAGRYELTASGIDFQPRFPFDPGREYEVVFDPSRAPDGSGELPPRAPVRVVVGLPAETRVPSTIVTAVHPSADVWPENLLRLYIHFSAPMSRTAGFDHVRLLDESGGEVIDPFLPLELDLWNPDYTRYTLFLDPGRVKRGILPNEQMGRAIVGGRTYTIEIAATWPDTHGQPLKQSYRRTFRVGPADDRPVNPASWTIEPPAGGTRDALVVSFPEPLDHGLLGRAVGVVPAGSDEPIRGEVEIPPGETSWRFTPDDPWPAGPHRLVVLSILEDPSGNRVGRLFEVDKFANIDPSAAPERHYRTFEIRGDLQVKK